MTSMFPLARPSGPISTEFSGIWDKCRCASKDEREQQDIPYYEKVCFFSKPSSDILMQKRKTESFDFSFERCS